MGKWFAEFKEVIWVASIAIATILYLLGTFATQAALAEKEKAITEYVDIKHENVKADLKDMKAVLDRIDQRVYEMRRQR
jgi:Na+-transporting NADH:ubiquinone oxidoreductase subunit NqrC